MSKYTIDTKETEFLSKAVLKNMDEVLENVAMFDLVSNFKVFDENKQDKTSEFLEFAAKKGYKFVDRRQILKYLPDELKKYLKKEFKKPVSINDLSIKFVHPDDIKSINGFYELWEKKQITIGTYANDKTAIIYFDTADNKVHCNKTNVIIEIC